MRSTPTAVACLAGALLACSGPGASEFGDAGPALGYPSCPTVTSACPSPPPSWVREVFPIINLRCNPCHSGGGANGAPSTLDYSTYAHVVQNRVVMAGQLASCFMPPSTAVAPTDEERRTLLAWFACDSPDN